MYYGGVNMISVRLSKELEDKIDQLSKQESVTKSDIIKEALEKYITEQEKKMKPYELGEEFFGRNGSGKGNLSKTYKKKVRDKINEKMSH
ncbi:MAG: CopG-like domain-containing protein DNA-binding [Halanaerobium sp. T82-1]|jgi:predicted DNA-binding protein|nr:MAG: CopG-like domain-containing protein DNA-binding [Halanaerobium sp. T82-1]